MRSERPESATISGPSRWEFAVLQRGLEIPRRPRGRGSLTPRDGENECAALRTRHVLEHREAVRHEPEARREEPPPILDRRQIVEWEGPRVNR